MTWSRECFAEPFTDDQGMDPAEIESRLFWLLFREHRMPSTQKSRIIDAHRPSLGSSLGSAENHSKPALGVRIWARVLAALHESREQEAARVIRRHRDLIQNFQAIELPGRGMEPKPMHDRRSGRRDTIEHIFIAALIIGFALALGFALNELDAALNGACSSLATIATIGG
jgi:hypothetical protein